jgi:hypothetical protein
MLALRNKQMMVLLIVLVSFILALAVSTAIIHAVNPSFLNDLHREVFGSYYGG